MVQSVVRHQFHVLAYRRMRELGIFSEDDRIELLDGEIYRMSLLGPLHIALVNRLTKLLIQMVGDSAVVSVQNAIQLDDYSGSQPDIVVLRPRSDDYEYQLAQPSDVLLLIEIADSSLEYDRTQKLPRYAAAGIAEVWIIDANRQVIEQFQQPLQDQYTQVYRCIKGQSIQSVGLPIIQIASDRLFR
ncbi:MAG: Uma2 family endonuclease [Roseiflexaceae bacterium]